jgi:cytochrome c peroxidase
VLAAIRSDAKLREGFRENYADSVTLDNLRDALATFEASLITPNAPFDRYLCGDETAIGVAAVKGYERFRDYGCISCHQGRNIGGNMFQRLGAVKEYFVPGRPLNPADLGRFNVTGDERDRHVFKVPSLRNVALTDPYFHDGSQATLPDAIRTMARGQLGIELTDARVVELVEFLNALTGEVPNVPR